MSSLRFFVMLIIPILEAFSINEELKKSGNMRISCNCKLRLANPREKEKKKRLNKPKITGIGAYFSSV